MTKILNLDQVAPSEVRELQIGGTKYPVKEMDVETFIKSSKLAEKMADSKSFADQMEASVQMIQMAVPDMPREVLTRLTLEQLAAVSKFVRGEEVEGGEGKA